ncbi:MAG: SHOCT domain-containing protein [Nitrososphaeraceae archaeon]
MTHQERNRLMRLAGWGLVGLIILIGISIAVSLIFFAPGSSGGGFYPFFFPFHFGWLGGIFLVFLVYFAIRWLFLPGRWDYHQYPHYRDDAHNILRERYAKGEITKEQFEQMTHDLEHPGGNHESSK